MVNSYKMLHFWRGGLGGWRSPWGAMEGFQVFGRLVLLIFCGLVLVMMIEQPAWAESCRTLHQQTVCLVDVKRSAKYYWEYRAVIRVNGEVQPQKLYDCRDRRETDSAGRSQPFAADGVGDLICRLLYHA